MKILAKLGDMGKTLGPVFKKFPKSPYVLFNQNIVQLYVSLDRQNLTGRQRNKLEDKITEIAKEVAAGEGGVMEKIEAESIDCYLYARMNKYVAR